ncbi:uncharacterized protein F4812DRAFT_193172 [Daldinia caldariorum]|uniref:uncharacterized protein n=1 Tax=Daldinia caldariorum TaxID=326644 RepID=UPI00200734AD|nr:uncharacterized protein F4812DRAFT_193172 [Daldinia caldariorum]KAI1471803.1 hypothetical protein F4812DRAFT_193172 [Daldinia caldariorum]
MDSSGGPKELRERLYSRAPSRASSASTANTQMTSRSSTSTSSYPRETSHTGSHPIHKYHHSHCSRSSIGGRPLSRLSRESSNELREPTASASSFLQERLQRERIERHASKMSADMSASTGDIRDRSVQNSPIKRSATSAARSQWSGNSDDLAKDVGMGARQMEQVRNAHNNARLPVKLNLAANSNGKTLSTLHKQNFDLKLELYHRREKQTALEERVEKLESQQSEMIDLHESIIHELEMKDDALAEAVTLIVELEARIDDLVREREMVRRVEADGSYRHSLSDHPNLESATTGAAAASVVANKVDPNVPHSTAHVNSLGRVPSFLSEHSQQTENLRNAVLRGRTSIMHMRKVSESSAAPSDINRIASSNLSVLSESSFVSIYGIKDMGEREGLQAPADVAGMDGSYYYDRSPTPTMNTKGESRYIEKTADPSQMLTGSPEMTSGGAKISARTRPINNVINLHSPLQEIERLEKQILVGGDIPRQTMPSRGSGTTTPTLPRPPIHPPQQGKTKQEKREALQKVLTNYPMYRDFSNPHAFPPTPDTVSSSTLRSQQDSSHSQDSLATQTRGVTNNGIMSIYDRIGALGRELGRELPYPAPSNEQAHTTAFTSHRQIPMSIANAHTFSDLPQLAQSLPPRPHSSAETISSHARAASLGSDSDSDGGADARSETDSFDYWMKESMKPNRYQTDLSEQRGSGRSTSPDLFSFPVDARGWETDVIFGALRGNGYLGSPVSALKRDPIDEMASSLQTSQTEVFDPPVMESAPPTPDRRSSLHARTGSTSVAPPPGGKFKKHPVNSIATECIEGRGRSNSIDSAAPMPSYTRGQPENAGTTTPGKRNHYPPISGQTSKGRGLGLNSFFRRQGPDNSSALSSATEATAPLATPSQLSAIPQTMRSTTKPSGRNSVPPPPTMPWRAPGIVEDDLQSATPPPIMRSRGMSLLSGTNGPRVADLATPQQQAAETSRPSTPTTIIQTNTTATGAQGGGRRKWLGLGRIGNSKTKTG